MIGMQQEPDYTYGGIFCRMCADALELNANGLCHWCALESVLKEEGDDKQQEKRPSKREEDSPSR